MNQPLHIIYVIEFTKSEREIIANKSNTKHVFEKTTIMI